MISVLVAGVGVLGTIFGAALTATITARAQGHQQLMLERQQVRQESVHRDDKARELRVEHLRWRRERRQAAYLDLLQALSAADHLNQQYFHELRDSAEPVAVAEGRLAEIRQHFKTAEQVGHRVLLEGPDQVADAAEKLLEQLRSLIREVRTFAEAYIANSGDLESCRTTVEEGGRQYLAEHRQFLRIARTALDQIIDTN
ncbi:hypothetical protein [Nocardia sp. NPDC005366]|uniref:hypothetical protein n=1 Tax=Nocardia sp. NPDC005366 TaxID=3156878 RepID=UPI0033AFD3A8